MNNIGLMEDRIVFYIESLNKLESMCRDLFSAYEKEDKRSLPIIELVRLYLKIVDVHERILELVMRIMVEMGGKITDITKEDLSILELFSELEPEDRRDIISLIKNKIECKNG
jgi:hypothetical protein